MDEFTGRTMPGRRWSDGLHQAVEAKEGLQIQNESVTLASISYQVSHPYVRRYANGTVGHRTKRVGRAGVHLVPGESPLPKAGCTGSVARVGGGVAGGWVQCHWDGASAEDMLGSLERLCRGLGSRSVVGSRERVASK